MDSILHFASPASPIDYLELPIQTLKVGSLGTHKALGLAKAKKARVPARLAPPRSTATRWSTRSPRTYWGNVNPVGPRGVYDEAKRFAEAMTMAYHRYHGVDTRIVRIFNTYGPRMRLNDGRARARLHVARRCAASRSPSSATARRPAASATSPTWSRASTACCLSDEQRPGEHRQPRGNHHPGVRAGSHRS